ncbi:uncharacterized protein [Cardiocondyla obscurior]|uniref:uncharacterized protein n=1 Tax=Cardiocondyla obscurior TaxID=286306 RepID=UPI003965883A
MNNYETHVQTEKILDASVLEILDARLDPERLFLKSIHEDLAVRFTEIIRRRLPLEEKNTLFKKFLLPNNCKFLDPPKLNLEIKVCLQDPVNKRDDCIKNKQQSITAVLAAVIDSITKILDLDNSVKLGLLENLNGAFRLLADLQYNESIIRRSLIQKKLDSSVREILISTVPDEWLFSKELEDKVKAAKVLESSSKNGTRSPQTERFSTGLADTKFHLLKPFIKPPLQTFSPIKPQWSSHESMAIRDSISRLLEKGAICCVLQLEDQFLFNIFLIEKPDESYRLILNLKKLNNFIFTQHFKLEDAKIVQRLIYRNCFMDTIDLKDAYYFVFIKDSCRKYLRFKFENKIYEFRCLLFSLSSAPFLFTKLIKPVVAWLRQQGFLSCIYLDDILVFGNSYVFCKENVQATCQLLTKLGFIINKKKSVFTPSTSCKFLGLIYNSIKMTVELPKEKICKIKKLLKKFKKIRKYKIRDFARFVGSLEFCCPTLKYERAHMRSFERERIIALFRNNDNYDASMNISDAISDDLRWWKDHIDLVCNNIGFLNPELVIFTDASLSGWGTVYNNKQVHGYWNDQE